VNWLTERNSFSIAVLLYGVSVIYGIFLLRRGFRRDDHINYLLLGTGFLFHTSAILLRGISLQRCPIHNLFEAVMFISWTIAAVNMVLGARPALRFIGAFAAPILLILGIFGLMPVLDAPDTDASFKGGWVSAHASLILASYSAFGLGGIAATMFLMQEHNLKYRKPKAFFALLPPLQRLELIVERMLLAGLICLSLGLAVGGATLKLPAGVSFWKDAKVHWSILVWLMYAGLLVAHWKFGQRGRRLAWIAVGGSAFVLFTFWGFNLLSNIHNP
jgi:ABC-type uncharacterized transport system permease subunit